MATSTCYLIPTAPQSPTSSLFCLQQSHPIKWRTLGHWPFWKPCFPSSVCVSPTTPQHYRTMANGAFICCWTSQAATFFAKSPACLPSPSDLIFTENWAALPLNLNTYSVMFGVDAFIHKASHYQGLPMVFLSLFLLCLYYVFWSEQLQKQQADWDNVKVFHCRWRYLGPRRCTPPW